MSQKIYQGKDYLPLTDRTVTAEGFLQAPAIVARTGIQRYYAYEFGLDKELGMDPNRVIKLYRPPEEVFSTDALRSGEGQTITVEHPASNVITSANWAELAKGDMRNVCQQGNDKVGALLTIKAADAIDSVMTGKQQISLGYGFILDWTPGVDPVTGESYDAVQRNIRINHVALVDSARCGSACRIADSQPSNSGDSTMNTQKITVDGIPLEVSDSAAGAINNLQTRLATANDALKEALAKVGGSVTFKIGDKDVTYTGDQLVKVLDAKDAEISQLKKDVFTPEQRDAMVADWGKMIGDAKRLAPDVTTDGKTCAAVRKEVVGVLVAKDEKAKATANAVLSGKTLDAADADTVRMLFNLLSVTTGEQTATTAADSAASQAMLQQKGGNGQQQQAVDAATAPVGRAAMLAREQAAWTGAK